MTWGVKVNARAQRQKEDSKGHKFIDVCRHTLKILPQRVYWVKVWTLARSQ